MTSLNGGFLAARFFSVGARRRASRPETTAGDAATPSSAAAPVAGPLMDNCGRSQSEGRFRLPSMPRFPKQSPSGATFGIVGDASMRRSHRQHSEDSGHVSSGAYDSPRLSAHNAAATAHLATPPTSPLPPTKTVLHTSALLTAHSDNSPQPMTATTANVIRRSRPMPIAVPSTTSATMAASHGHRGSPAHTTYSPRFPRRRGSDSFLFDFPLRAGPSGHPWPSPAPASPNAPQSPPLSALPTRTQHAYRRARDSAISVTSSTDTGFGDYPIAASRMRRTITDETLLEVEDDSDGACPAQDAAPACEASTEILSTSPPGVHAWRRRRSLAVVDHSFLTQQQQQPTSSANDASLPPWMHLDPEAQTGTRRDLSQALGRSVSESAYARQNAYSTVFDPSAELFQPNDASWPDDGDDEDNVFAWEEMTRTAAQQQDARLELWEARHRLRSLGGLDAVLSRTDTTTVRCTLTPAVCRDALAATLSCSTHAAATDKGRLDQAIDEASSLTVATGERSPMLKPQSSRDAKWSFNCGLLPRRLRSTKSDDSANSNGNSRGVRSASKRLSLPAFKTARTHAFSLPTFASPSLSGLTLRAAAKEGNMTLSSSAEDLRACRRHRRASSAHILDRTGFAALGAFGQTR
ncbi:hypothetical protein THASP1DRAFT_29944 [Thamnocephalis sphaerospora]|uniref:Uncharacterized protein n=1 Tax=Thamnocephalis sphaerospora TaxID=78915 RepID=A0A4P9XQE2_9FUNG|nr:hypothetical protein THASP1DRAFT_29944 [Thamnocephalis sphaerospora]|eukprot:RKP08248.1 hypothetical protein THASP1DRAFT_29944 [Thamnocephalis sphaerospora]